MRFPNLQKQVPNMKRKKWSELEEQTLLTKYADLLTTGSLSKLKTRQKKFQPVADHVNSVHHLQDPYAFPFKWLWRDVSIKVQNMRHQYLGVKQKIRVSEDEYNWEDGANHWENFLKYKEVFGDIELEVKGGGIIKKLLNGCDGSDLFEDCSDLEFGIEEEEEEESDSGDGGSGGESGVHGEGESNGKTGNLQGGKAKKGFVYLGSQVTELRNVIAKREEKIKEREFIREKEDVEIMEKRRKIDFEKEMRIMDREVQMESREAEVEEREYILALRERERVRLWRHLDEERRMRRLMEEKREEEEMEWRERMLGLQIEHEKSMMQLHADACQNQMQILGIMARSFCQFFGAGNDGLGGGLGGLPPQVLQNLQHLGGLGDNGKPDSNSPSEFM